MIRSLTKLALLLSVMLPSNATAGFLTNYARWKEISPSEQGAYLAGVMDHWSRTSTPGEAPWRQAQRTGINKCVREQQIDTGMLVDLVNTHYETYTADWRFPPAAVIVHVMSGTCLEDVNSEREKAGFPKWDRKPAQLSD